MRSGKCKCGVELTLENSTPSIFKKRAGLCKLCKKEYRLEHYKNHIEEIRKRAAEYYRNNVEKTKNRASEWAKKNPEKKQAIGRSWARRNTDYFRLKNYGVPPEEFDRKFEAQKGLCAICQLPMFGKRKACQDHDHISGKNRDILCGSCNCLLGYSYEKQEILAKAISYLQKHADGSSTQTESVQAA